MFIPRPPRTTRQQLNLQLPPPTPLLRASETSSHGGKTSSCLPGTKSHMVKIPLPLAILSPKVRVCSPQDTMPIANHTYPHSKMACSRPDNSPVLLLLLWLHPRPAPSSSLSGRAGVRRGGSYAVAFFTPAGSSRTGALDATQPSYFTTGSVVTA